MSSATIQAAMSFELFNMGSFRNRVAHSDEHTNILAGLNRENLIFAVHSRQDRKRASRCFAVATVTEPARYASIESVEEES